MYTYKILQNYTDDSFHSSFIIFDKDSYMFNCPDGTQRNALDQGMKFTKVKSIFFNSHTTLSHLGTYGFAMSRGEQTFNQFISKTKEIENQIKEEKYTKFAIKNKIAKNNETNLLPTQLKLFGPKGFTEHFKFSNYFCPVPLGKSLFEYNDDKFVNKNVFVQKELKQETMNEFKDENLSVIPVEITDSKNQDSVLSFICIPAQKKPKFLVSKAKELGLKPGPIFAKLQGGESVTLDNGTVIRPEDVLDSPQPSSCLVVIYLPTEEHMNSLVKSEKMKAIISNQKNYTISDVVHITPFFNIINNDTYINFMRSFGNTKHIIDCKETNTKFMYNEGKIKIQILLNKVNPYLFPETKFSYEDTRPQKELKFKEELNDIDSSSPGKEYILYPHERKGLISSALYKNEPYYFKSESCQKFLENIKDINIQSNMITDSNNEQIKEPRVTFLGTTAMKPSKYRNVTSILIRIPFEDKYVMFDCGEGTYQQLLEHYGKKETNQILMKLGLVSVSHKHGDHMLGLIKILTEIDALIEGENSDNFIFIIVPTTIINFVINTIILDIKHKQYFRVFPCQDFNPNETQVYKEFLNKNNPYEGFQDVPRSLDFNIEDSKIKNFRKNKEIYEEIEKKLGIYFYAIEVFHCEESYGCFIMSSENSPYKYFKISFSGDTRPNNNFLNYSNNSTLLIHEGTFDDEMVSDAKDKMHSTISEAIELSLNNMTKNLVLTHFSPRYIKTYPFSEKFEKHHVLIAHDFLTFSLSDLTYAYNYLKPFEQVIKDIEEKETKTKKDIL